MKIQLAAAALLSLAQPALAQQAPPAGAPPRAGASHDPAAAPAGAYALDPRHTSVIARVGHNGGMSFSTFRFGVVSGTLDWNGTDPAKSHVDITVDMTSLETPVPNFASELIGDRFLKTAQFHDAKFVSSTIRRTGPTSGVIDGMLTFMGQTKPASIDAVMVGTGPGRTGQVIGFSGKMRFKRSDFGFASLMGVIADDVEIMIDTEFKTA